MLTWKASVQDSCEFLGERVKGEELDTPELDRTGVQSNLLKQQGVFIGTKNLDREDNWFGFNHTC